MKTKPNLSDQWILARHALPEISAALVSVVLVLLLLWALLLVWTLNIFVVLAIPIIGFAGFAYMGYKIHCDEALTLPPASQLSPSGRVTSSYENVLQAQKKPVHYSIDIAPSSMQSCKTISLYEVNNPGNGDCMYYAFAIGLINQIKKEHRTNRPQESNNKTYQKLQMWLQCVANHLQDENGSEVVKDLGHAGLLNFNLVTREPSTILEGLKTALRQIRYLYALEQLRDSAGMHAENMADKEKRNFRTVWQSNEIFVEFFQLLSKREADCSPLYNVFAAIKSSQIKSKIQYYRNRIDEFYKLPGCSGQDFESLDCNLRIKLFLQLLYGEDVSVQDINQATPFAEDSSIIAAMKLWRDTQHWGTLLDLNALSECFEVVHPIIVGNHMNFEPREDNSRPTFFIRLQPGHWTTGLAEADVEAEQRKDLVCFNVRVPES
jgi:hypothetical protein